MARRKRDIESSDIFHVSNKGVDGQDIFGVVDDWALFGHLVGDAVARHECQVVTFAWMTNHFHMIVRCDGRSLAGMMHQLQSAYAVAFNARTKRSGPLFDRRFFSVPIRDDAQFLQCARYVHRNPVAICGSRRLAAYRWSSLPTYLGRTRGPAWLSTSLLAGLIDPVRYLDRLISPHEWDRFPIDALPPLERTTVADITSALDRLRRGGGFDVRTARTLAIVLALDMRVADVVELADTFDVSPASLRQTRHRTRIRMTTEPSLRRLYESVAREVSNPTT